MAFVENGVKRRKLGSWTVFRPLEVACFATIKPRLQEIPNSKFQTRFKSQIPSWLRSRRPRPAWNLEFAAWNLEFVCRARWSKLHDHHVGKPSPLLRRDHATGIPEGWRPVRARRPIAGGPIEGSGP